MKFTHSFAAFMKNTVNLNKTRVTQADAAFDTLTSFVKNTTETKDIFKKSSRQGSLWQGTIIRPRTDETEFDVDMLVDVKDVGDWKAADYLDPFHNAFKNSDRYKDLVDRRGKNRCVRIDFATNDFHVDIVPSVERSGQCCIMNRKTNTFELTDGDGYAAWFTGRNDITGGAELVRVVRLCKYLRDEHDWPVKSILLTTLLGLQVYDSDGSAKFTDTPTALITLLSRTDTWLEAQTRVPLTEEGGSLWWLEVLSKDVPAAREFYGRPPPVRHRPEGWRPSCRRPAAVGGRVCPTPLEWSSRERAVKGGGPLQIWVRRTAVQNDPDVCAVMSMAPFSAW